MYNGGLLIHNDGLDYCRAVQILHSKTVVVSPPPDQTFSSEN
jgi:hypothetical protein